MSEHDERRAQQARYLDGLARVRWTQDWLDLQRRLAAWPRLPPPVGGERVVVLTEQQCAPLVQWMQATGQGPVLPLPLLPALTAQWPWVRRAVLVPPQLILHA